MWDLIPDKLDLQGVVKIICQDYNTIEMELVTRNW